MTVVFTPSGSLNVAHDPSDLPEEGDGNNVISGAMVRCKNLRIDQKGIAKTRDGTFDLGSVESPIWHVEIQGGVRYVFSSTHIYEDEISIASGLTSEPWSAIQYNAFNDNAPNVFALNGTDRKRIEGGEVHEWGIAAPTVAPILEAGLGTGLTGEYNARYTYVRKEGSVVIAESNPSPAATNSVVLSGQSLSARVGQPEDPQVTHIRLYRTLASGTRYFLVDEIEASTIYAFGYTHDWESTGYIDGVGYKFTIEDTSDETVVESPSVFLTGVTSLSFTTAGYRLGSDGVAYRRNTAGTYTALSGQWRLSGVSSDYECMATKVSGTTPSGTLGAWVGLDQSQSWELSAFSQCVLLVKIRDAETQNVLAAANITIWRDTTL